MHFNVQYRFILDVVVGIRYRSRKLKSFQIYLRFILQTIQPGGLLVNWCHNSPHKVIGKVIWIHCTSGRYSVFRDRYLAHYRHMGCCKCTSTWCLTGTPRRGIFLCWYILSTSSMVIPNCPFCSGWSGDREGLSGYVTGLGAIPAHSCEWSWVIRPARRRVVSGFYLDYPWSLWIQLSSFVYLLKRKR